jgi:hypothetical protein
VLGYGAFAPAVIERSMRVIGRVLREFARSPAPASREKAY